MASKQSDDHPYRTPLPAHALAEIEADPKQREFWANWQAVGDAKLDAADSAQVVATAESDFIDCRIKSGMRTAPGPVCGCGKHYDRLVKARADFEKHAAPIARAIDKFKGKVK